MQRPGLNGLLEVIRAGGALMVTALGLLGLIHRLATMGVELKLDFTHFKRHKRGNLQYDGKEWRGVSVHRSWRSIVKNPPTPTTSGYAQR